MGFSGFDLNSKTAVVIGGTSGIGLAIARGLVTMGANVVATGRRSDLVDSVAKEITALGGRTLACPCDVTDRASLERLMGRVEDEFGGANILVNCAGVIRRTPTLQVSEEDWNRILDTNLTGTLRACQIFARRMIERKYGRIINIASLTAFVALYEVAAYGASKSGVASLTKSLAVEWAPHGVCVNAIVPGVFRTELNAKLLDSTPRGAELLMRTPMRRFGKIEEVVGAAIFLASEAASFITGAFLVVDGGILASGVNQ
jgi:NAD(P)-dependent dehydrogenase (short-subunit alcohol dehydrogenase family)